jgi:phospholipid/cholesterol/gamma-HCH transport system substrate-binding protein
VRQQRSLVEILDVAPLALSNLNLAYNPRSGTLDTRDNLLGPYDPASFVCSLMVDLLPAAKVSNKCFALAQTLQAKKLPMTDQLRKLLKLPPSPPPSAKKSEPAPAPQQREATVDRTLGGILRGTP